MIIENLNNCTKKYSIVYTDPPWQQSRGRQEKHPPEFKRLAAYIQNNAAY